MFGEGVVLTKKYDHELEDIILQLENESAEIAYDLNIAVVRMFEKNRRHTAWPPNDGFRITHKGHQLVWRPSIAKTALARFIAHNVPKRGDDMLGEILEYACIRRYGRIIDSTNKIQLEPQPPWTGASSGRVTTESPVKNNIPKLGEPTMLQKIEKKTFVNGTDVANMDATDLITLIETTKAEIKRLEDVNDGIDSTKISEEIKVKTRLVKHAVKLLDEK